MTLEHLAAAFPDWAGTASELIRGSIRSLLDLQRVVQQSLASEFHGVRDDASGAALASLLGLAFVFGGVHTVTPGHGMILGGRWLVELLAAHGAGIERMAATLQILGAAAVMTIGLTLFLGELA